MTKPNFVTFTPGELAQITGISSEQQRDWRRRGFLDSEEGGKHKRYQLFDVCWMLALKEAIDAGIPVSHARDFASAAMNDIEFFVLRKLGRASGDGWPFIIWSKRRAGVSRVRDLAVALPYFEKDHTLLLMSCKAVAETIVDRAPKSLVVDA